MYVSLLPDDDDSQFIWLKVETKICRDMFARKVFTLANKSPVIRMPHRNAGNFLKKSIWVEVIFNFGAGNILLRCVNFVILNIGKCGFERGVLQG